MHGHCAKMHWREVERLVTNERATEAAPTCPVIQNRYLAVRHQYLVLHNQYLVLNIQYLVIHKQCQVVQSSYLVVHDQYLTAHRTMIYVLFAVWLAAPKPWAALVWAGEPLGFHLVLRS